MKVGMREVNQKRDHLRTHVGKKIGKFLGGDLIPVVMGPRDRYYIIDHHHLALALHKEASSTARQRGREFEHAAARRLWLPITMPGASIGKGRRREFADIPRSITVAG